MDVESSGIFRSREQTLMAVQANTKLGITLSQGRLLMRIELGLFCGSRRS